MDRIQKTCLSLAAVFFTAWVSFAAADKQVVSERLALLVGVCVAGFVTSWLCEHGRLLRTVARVAPRALSVSEYGGRLGAALLGLIVGLVILTLLTYGGAASPSPTAVATAPGTNPAVASTESVDFHGVRTPGTPTATPPGATRPPTTDAMTAPEDVSSTETALSPTSRQRPMLMRLCRLPWIAYIPFRMSRSLYRHSSRQLGTFSRFGSTANTSSSTSPVPRHPASQQRMSRSPASPTVYPRTSGSLGMRMLGLSHSSATETCTPTEGDSGQPGFTTWTSLWMASTLSRLDPIDGA